MATSGNGKGANAERLLTPAEVASLFRVDPKTVTRWAKAGKLQSIRPGRRIYVRRAQIRSLLRPRQRGVPADQLDPGLFDWES